MSTETTTGPATAVRDRTTPAEDLDPVLRALTSRGLIVRDVSVIPAGALGRRESIRVEFTDASGLLAHGARLYGSSYESGVRSVAFTVPNSLRDGRSDYGRLADLASRASVGSSLGASNADLVHVAGFLAEPVVAAVVADGRYALERSLRAAGGTTHDARKVWEVLDLADVGSTTLAVGRAFVEVLGSGAPIEWAARRMATIPRGGAA